MAHVQQWPRQSRGQPSMGCVHAWQHSTSPISSECCGRASLRGATPRDGRHGCSSRQSIWSPCDTTRCRCGESTRVPAHDNRCRFNRESASVEQQHPNTTAAVSGHHLALVSARRDGRVRRLFWLQTSFLPYRRLGSCVASHDHSESDSEPHIHHNTGT